MDARNISGTVSSQWVDYRAAGAPMMTVDPRLVAAVHTAASDTNAAGRTLAPEGAEL